MCAATTRPAATAPWIIRPFTSIDRTALLRLNAGARPAVAALDETTLSGLLAFEGHHFVAVDRAGAVAGYLLSFLRESDYDDTEIRELRRRLPEPFLYICQVVVAPEYRRQRIGRAFYATMEATARRSGVRLLCCDVNTRPPNPESFAFHRRLGLAEIGSRIAGDGTAIAFLVRRW
ncbi:MAG: GNAT family N-acetyltransferase [Verrucomicrobia bacterium]|nr:GNAT family N-acetyltransferase [Verrucomicrobiota bacterium]